MQRFSPTANPKRGTSRQAAGATPARDTEEHREDEEIAAVSDWLAHISAGRIAVR